MSAGGAPGVSPPLASGEGSSRLWSSNERDLRWIGGYLYLRLPVSSTSTDLSTASRVFTGSSQASVGSNFSCKGERMAGASAEGGRHLFSSASAEGGRHLCSSSGGGRVLHRAADGFSSGRGRRDGFFTGGGRVLHRAADGFCIGRRKGSSPGDGRVLHRAADGFCIGRRTRSSSGKQKSSQDGGLHVDRDKRKGRKS